MLTSVHIQNFRLCADVRIDNIGPVLALVGRNGSGKTNILQAIWQAAHMASSSGEAIALHDYRFWSHQPLVITLKFAIERTEYEYGLSVELVKLHSILRPLVTENLSAAEGGRERQSLIRREGGRVEVGQRPQPLQIGELVTSLPALATLLPSDDPVVSAIKPALSFLSAIRYYPLDEPAVASADAGPISEADYVKWQTTFEATGYAPDSVVLRIVHMSVKDQEGFEALKSLIGPNGLGLVNDIAVNLVGPPEASTSSNGGASGNKFYFVSFLPNRGRGLSSDVVAIDGLSLGTRRVLRMLVSMLFDRSTVMLLEQPEDSLHQGLTRALMGLLRQNAVPAQLIVASHSSVVLNTLSPEEIRLVSLHKGFTQVRPLTRKEVDAATEFAHEQGPLYDFLETVQQED